MGRGDGAERQPRVRNSAPTGLSTPTTRVTLTKAIVATRGDRGQMGGCGRMSWSSGSGHSTVTKPLGVLLSEEHRGRRSQWLEDFT